MDIPTENILNVTGNCFDYVRVFSNGILNVKHGESILQYALVRFHVQILLMFFLANSFHFLLRRFHFSRFTSYLLTGLVLGPSLMGRYSGGKLADALFHPTIPNNVIASFSKIGFILFVFFSGVQMDTSIIRKTGRTAFMLGILMTATTYIVVENVEYKFSPDIPLTPGTKAGFATAAIIQLGSIIQTQFVGVSYLLMHLRMTNSQLGHLALATSLVGEIVRVSYATLFGFKNIFVNISVRTGFQTIISASLFILFIVTVLRKMVFAFIRSTPEGQPPKEIYSVVTLGLVFLLSSCGDSVGLNYYLGPLIFGLVVPARSPLAEVLVAKFDTAVSGFLLPILSIFCASKIDLKAFFTEFHTLLNFQVSLSAYVVQAAITFVAVLCCKIPLRHAAALTVILNTKGFFELGLFFSFDALKQIQSTSGVLLLFLLQAFQPLLVRRFYQPSEHYLSYKQKGLQNASDDAELRILACAHRQEDAMAAIKLLQYSNATKQSPLSICGLCLEELVSSYIPLLIDHQLGQRLSSVDRSHSQPIIDIFRYFKSQHKKFVQLHVFTAVSPLKQMQEDICWLSFNKACSLIIVPFHMRWNSKGRIVSSNNDLRQLNINVLERAPCSVGILIDRSRINGMLSIFDTTITYRVTTLFVGGPDDREALAYALRMARSPQVHLTIMHFVTQNNDVERIWGSNIVDDEFLRTARVETSGLQNISFRKETVNDGSDTCAIIPSIVGDTDLVMVGRSHETEHEALSGISEEWIDLPELGCMGDLLASKDISSAVSVLVIQQQQMMNASHSSASD